MAGEILFYGATVERSDDNGTTWEAVPGVKTFGIPEESVEYVETTSLDSTGGYREYIAGLKDLGEASMVQNYSRAAMAQLEADKFTLMKYRITFANGDELEFDAIRSGSATPSDIGALVEISSTLRGSGQPVFTPGA